MARPGHTAPERTQARARRQREARKFRPAKIEVLLVAEAPPTALDRYFYFTDVREHDDLFRYVYRAVLEREPTRERKAEHLAELCDRGVFLIDLSPDPLREELLSAFVPGLARRCRQLNPGKIILIKTTVYDAAYQALVDAELPVIDERVPFPGSGQQRRFLEHFPRALAKRAADAGRSHPGPRTTATRRRRRTASRSESVRSAKPATGGHRSRYTRAELRLIRDLLTELRRAERSRQKTIRAQVRRMGFFISDYATDQQGFTASDLDELVRRRVISVEGADRRGA